MALLLGGGLSVGALLALFPREPEAIPLTKQQVDLPAERDVVFQQLSAFEQGARVLERRADQLIVEFPITVGGYQVTTLERVTIDPVQRRMTFEQVRSPFFSIRTATESFDLSVGRDGGTTLTVTGVLVPRLGAFGSLVTRLLVRPRWDQIEAKHLEQLRRRMEARAG